MSTNPVELTRGTPIGRIVDTVWLPPGAVRYGLVKRALDATLGAALLVLALPVIAAAMVITRLVSAGPSVYSQTRVGRDGRVFTMYKVRTMVLDSERETGPVWSLPGDPRVTPFGRFLRRTHLDELPQLWNVVRGEMSLVGPRPERPEIVAQLESALPQYARRLLATPGLTGLAQVSIPPDTDLSTVRRKLAFDLFYIERQGLWLDLRLCLCTAGTLLGVPFATSTRLLRVPGEAAVARAFPGLLHTSGATRQARGTAGTAGGA